jgi:hypothetical protein
MEASPPPAKREPTGSPRPIESRLPAIWEQSPLWVHVGCATPEVKVRCGGRIGRVQVDTLGRKAGGGGSDAAVRQRVSMCWWH